MEDQSEQTNVVQMEPTKQVVQQQSEMDPTVQQPEAETTHQLDQVVTTSASVNDLVTTIPQSSLDEPPDPNNEPQIEVPLLSDSGNRVFKVQVSLTDFCKLPVSAITNCETNEKLSPTGSHDLQLDKSFIREPEMESPPDKCDLNSNSSLIQMPGANSGDGVPCQSSHISGEPIVVRHTSALLPTQVGIDQSGNVLTDFPFDDKALSLKERRVMSGNTLLPPKK